MSTKPTPELGPISRTNGVAGQLSYTVTVTYPNEEPRPVTFVGSQYGGPVVMIVGSMEDFVDDPSRFGDFSPAWVRRFFGVD